MRSLFSKRSDCEIIVTPQAFDIWEIYLSVIDSETAHHMMMISASAVAFADAVSAVAEACTAAAVWADAAVEIHIFAVVGVDFGVGSRHEVAAVPLRMQ